MDTLNELTSLYKFLSRFRPLPTEIVEELSHRFAIRLAHHSTAIEGNTLTQSETEIVIEKGITIGGKSVREHLEVIGHQEALEFVLSLSEADANISERDIKDIHSLVMKGQSNGDSGAYRTLNVKAAGTEFTYPEHLHVPEMMHSFVAWLNSAGDSHPVQFASEAHLRFVTIHPFRDGNGRVGRLLLNLLLIRAGYTVAVIPVSRRAEYIDALVAAQSSAAADGPLTLVVDSVRESMVEVLDICVSSVELAGRLDSAEEEQFANLMTVARNRDPKGHG